MSKFSCLKFTTTRKLRQKRSVASCGCMHIRLKTTVNTEFLPLVSRFGCSRLWVFISQYYTLSKTKRRLIGHQRMAVRPETTSLLRHKEPTPQGCNYGIGEVVAAAAAGFGGFV